MRFVGVALLATCALSQQAPFTLDRVLGAPFPSSLTQSPSGKVAWVSNLRGVRNVMVAEAPDFRTRKVTAYTEDDGQEIGELTWMPDAAAIVYVRGGTANPASHTAGVSEDVWLVTLDGAAPRKLGAGNSPAVSPKGDRVAWVRNGAIWWSGLDGK
ncbi:MAG TPA: hypothetical protein VNV86_16050, partial [Candidatus Acidoferrum sp.]|nr:hypothetical protein [Candidatus Acidoferrum sp.]